MGSYVGQRMPRYDSLGHVTGKTQFVDDITLPGMLTIKVRRSPVARAKILNIDTTEAKKCPGVYAVATAKDVPHNLCGFYGDHPVLAENEIRFRGQVIAAVAAIDEDAAMEALSKVKIDLEELTPIFDPREAMKPDSEQIRPEGNLWEFEPGMRVRQLRKGDIEKGFAQADVIVEGDYSTCVGEHAMLEPCCSIGDIDERGRLVIYTASQAPSLHATMIAGTLGLPLNKLNMVGGTVGGGFGGRNDPVADHLVGLLAMMTQKPCKWRWTREEEMVCAGPGSSTSRTASPKTARLSLARLKRSMTLALMADSAPTPSTRACSLSPVPMMSQMSTSTATAYLPISRWPLLCAVLVLILANSRWKHIWIKLRKHSTCPRGNCALRTPGRKEP